jgi:hypothetical protein
MRMPQRTFRSICIKLTCGFTEQLRTPSLESGMERLAPARPAERQFPVPAWEPCLGLATVAIAKSTNMQFKIRDRRPMLRLSSMSDRVS